MAASQERFPEFDGAELDIVASAAEMLLFVWGFVFLIAVWQWAGVPWWSAFEGEFFKKFEIEAVFLHGC